jgi:hypothetical protein
MRIACLLQITNGGRKKILSFTYNFFYYLQAPQIIMTHLRYKLLAFINIGESWRGECVDDGQNVFTETKKERNVHL